uniref:Anoctamin n=1 Tax=Esox lucius TaxID=8010 RepID=A0A6Q2Y4Q4_ESOLU
MFGSFNEDKTSRSLCKSSPEHPTTVTATTFDKWSMLGNAGWKITYVLLSAPWSVLCYYAEEISLQVPLQVVTTPNFNWSEKMLEKTKIPNIMSQDLYEILARTPYGSLERGEVGIDRLLSEKAFTAAYPLHEGPFEMPKDGSVDPKALSLRQILHRYWARWACWYKYQPLDHIREYYGEKIALYFAWLGFYTGWLLPAAVVGTVVFLFGIWQMVNDTPCMCTTSIFMALWAVTFLEYWKRSNAVLTHRWDCSEFQEIEERPRPEFTALAPLTMRNPVTGAEEPYFPEKRRFRRTLTSSMVIVIMVSVVLMFVIAIILYRVILSIIIYKSNNAFLIFSAGRIASLSGSVLNLLVILMLSRVYIYLAHFLTHWEMHRTQTKYEDMFILKVFIFQFVNFYSSPVYIAFFKGRFVGFPGNYYTLLGIRNEDCGAGGCLIELAQELLVIMVGKQLINNIQEFIVPKMKSWWQRRQLRPTVKTEDEEVERKGQVDDAAPWETDYELLVCEGLFDEYLEMVLQFGFITIFVAACPLAPLFALINNWVEVRLDAQKFVCQYRRPVVERAKDIGIWMDILQVITQVAVISNAFLIAFTTDFLPRLYYRYNNEGTLEGYVNFTLATSPSSYNAVSFLFLFSFTNGIHVVFFIGRLIDLMVPDIPEEVEIKIKREHYMAKEALAENQVRLASSRISISRSVPRYLSL